MMPGSSHFPDNAVAALWAAGLCGAELAGKCLWGPFPHPLSPLCSAQCSEGRGEAGLRAAVKSGESDPCHNPVDFPQHFLRHQIPHSVQNKQWDPHFAERFKVSTEVP